MLESKVKDLLALVQSTVNKTADIRKDLNSIQALISVILDEEDVSDIEIVMAGETTVLESILEDIGDEADDLLNEDLKDLEKSFKVFRKLLTSIDRALDNMED